jgi:hypothetical protein
MIGMNRNRSYSEQQLRDAVADAATWRDVMEALGKPRANSASHMQEHARQLGLDTSHFVTKYTGRSPVKRDLPFTSPVSSGARSGLSIAARWFLDRGYAVSLPIEPTPYDLIADSDDGLQRIQVKTTGRSDRAGGYRARLTRTIYDQAANPNARGNYREVPYGPDMIDYFFIVVTDGSMYLIPYEVVAGFMVIQLRAKYAAFVIS